MILVLTSELFYAQQQSSSSILIEVSMEKESIQIYHYLLPVEGKIPL